MTIILVGIQNSILVLDSSNGFKIHESLKGTSPQKIVIYFQRWAESGSDVLIDDLYGYLRNTLNVEVQRALCYKCMHWIQKFIFLNSIGTNQKELNKDKL